MTLVATSRRLMVAALIALTVASTADTAEAVEQIGLGSSGLLDQTEQEPPVEEPPREEPPVEEPPREEPPVAEPPVAEPPVDAPQPHSTGEPAFAGGDPCGDVIGLFSDSPYRGPGRAG